MPKGQQKSNREAKKPKADKKVAPPSGGSLATSASAKKPPAGKK